MNKYIIRETPAHKYIIEEAGTAWNALCPLPTLSMAIISINKCRPAHIADGEQITFRKYGPKGSYKPSPINLDKVEDLRIETMIRCRSLPAYDGAPLAIKNKIYDLMKTMVMRYRNA